jgi:beta-phosphoglucomutase
LFFLSLRLSLRLLHLIFAPLMSTPIKAFIFDLDGVIVDTAGYHFQSWKTFAANHGFDIPEVLNKKLKGLSRMVALDGVLAFAPKEFREQGDKVAMAKEKNDLYLEHLTALSDAEILPGMVRFLEEARSLGLKLAVGSGSKNATSILARLGITPMFDAVRDGNHIERSKPDPQVFELACEQLGVSPAEAVVFEDAEVGIDAAIAGGMFPVGVGDPEHLPHARIIIDGFAYLHAGDFLRTLQEIRNA